MHRQMLKSKIHRATATGCEVDYVGSVTTDTDLLEQANILPSELVHVDEANRIIAVDSHPELLLTGTGARS